MKKEIVLLLTNVKIVQMEKIFIEKQFAVLIILLNIESKNMAKLSQMKNKLKLNKKLIYMLKLLET